MENGTQRFLAANLGAITDQVISQALEQSVQTETIKIPSGTLLGTHTAEVTLGAKYKNCNGVGLVVIASQANLNFRVGLRDTNFIFVQKTSYKLLAFSDVTPMNQRFMAVRMPAASRKIYVDVQTFGTLTADLEFDIVFNLSEPNK